MQILSHIVPRHRGTKFHIFVYKIIAYRSILEALLQCPKILQYSGIQFSPRLQPHSHGPGHVRLPLLAEQVHKKQMLKITRCFAAPTVFCSLGTTNGTGPLFQRVAILMVSQGQDSSQGQWGLWSVQVRIRVRVTTHSEWRPSEQWTRNLQTCKTSYLPV